MGPQRVESRDRVHPRRAVGVGVADEGVTGPGQRGEVGEGLQVLVIDEHRVVLLAEQELVARQVGHPDGEARGENHRRRHRVPRLLIASIEQPAHRGYRPGRQREHSDARRRGEQHRHHGGQPARVAVEQVAELADEPADRAAERRRRMHDRHHQQQPHRQRPPDPPDQQDDRAGRGQDDQRPLDGKVVEVTGVLHDRIDQTALPAFMGDELVPDDDLGLL